MRHCLTAVAGRRLAPIALAIALAACSSESTTAPTASTTTSITVDASVSTGFISLSGTPHLIIGTDTASVASWDISVNATTVANSGGTSVYCVCEHEAATDAAVMAFTADAELTTFDAVSAGDIPGADQFTAAVFDAHKWYRYNLTGDDHQIWPTFNIYLLRRGSAVYKLQFTNYYDVSGVPRHISIRVGQLHS